MVKVNLIGFDRLLKRIDAAPANIKKQVGAEIQFAAEDFRERAINDAPVDQTILTGQITVKHIDAATLEVVSGAKYSAYMEFGTKGKYQSIPGIDASPYRGKGTGDYFDFLNNILDWVKRKGIGGKYRGSIAAGRVTLSKKKQDTLVETAEAIAWSIIRNGVKPHPFFFKQIGPVRKQLLRRVVTVLKDTI